MQISEKDRACQEVKIRAAVEMLGFNGVNIRRDHLYEGVTGRGATEDDAIRDFAAQIDGQILSHGYGKDERSLPQTYILPYQPN